MGQGGGFFHALGFFLYSDANLLYAP
jgi:hypothetical protein